MVPFLEKPSSSTSPCTTWSKSSLPFRLVLSCLSGGPEIAFWFILICSSGWPLIAHSARDLRPAGFEVFLESGCPLQLQLCAHCNWLPVNPPSPAPHKAFCCMHVEMSLQSFSVAIPSMSIYSTRLWPSTCNPKHGVWVLFSVCSRIILHVKTD